MFTDDVASNFQEEMGYSRREFLANLPAAFRNMDYFVAENGIVKVNFESGIVTIAPGAEQQRKIASLSLPFIPVAFKFENLDSHQRKRFYHAFQRSYQKGGG